MMAAAQIGTVHDAPKTPYEVDERMFPAGGTIEEQQMFLLRYAILAPSTHNTQPWRFSIDQNGIEVYADYTRRLPVADPGSRELLMSIGAAVMNLRVAAAHFDLSCRVDYDHSGGSERPLAMVSFTPAARGVHPDAPLAALFPALRRRHTNRRPFLISRVPAALLQDLERASRGFLTELVVSTDGKRNEQVANLVAAGDRILQADPAYRRDVAEWVRTDWTGRLDGIPGTALGVTGVASTLAPWTTRVLDLGKKRAAEDRNLCVEAPALVVLAGEDAPPHFLDAGELLERLLLTLTLSGLQTSYFNMPVQVPDLRLQLRSTLELSSWPQLLLRVGYCLAEGPRTPRRPVEDVLMTEMRV
jgi:hypothetical protein